MQQLIITIGRNRRPSATVDANKPLPDADWASFVADVSALLRQITTAAPETHYGVGEWAGVAEESAKVSVVLDAPVLHTAAGRLRRRLASLAARYDQAAVALAVAQSELIHA